MRLKKCCALLLSVVLLGGLSACAAEPEDDWSRMEAERAALLSSRREQEKRLAAVGTDTLQSLRQFSFASAKPVLEIRAGKNSVYSPVSLYMALSMLAEATGDTTRSEVLNALHLPDIQNARESTSLLFDALCFENDMGSLRLANSVWLSKEYPFQPEIAKQMQNTYRAETEEFDPADAQSSKKIADWIRKNTGGKLEPGELPMSDDLVAMLINAIYFKDQWESQFYESATEEAAFTLEDGTDVTSSFMRQSSHMEYAEGDGWRKAALSFRNGGRMCFLLPDKDISPLQFLSNTDKLESALYSQMETRLVDIRLPKFDFACELPLNDAVQALGIHSAFDPMTSNFTPLTPIDEVYISKVVQGAGVTVDENGCEAAAYTIIAIEAGGAIVPDDLAELTLDRPFLFTIEAPSGKDGSAGPILFIGVVENPTEK